MRRGDQLVRLGVDNPFAALRFDGADAESLSLILVHHKHRAELRAKRCERKGDLRPLSRRLFFLLPLQFGRRNTDVAVGFEPAENFASRLLVSRLHTGV